MIRSTGVFLQTADFTALFQLKHKVRMEAGILRLRSADGDLPILKEWKSAKALLMRYRTAASAFLDGKTAELGKVWIEQLPGHHGTPWLLEEDDYAQAHIRTRICLVAAPDAFTHSGNDRVLLGVGVVNVVEHRVLHSETNLSPYPRTHLIVDVKRPDEDTDG